MQLKKLLVVFFILLAQMAIAQESKTWTLKECIDYALENNIQVQQNEINQQIANQDVKASKYNTLPTLNGFANHTYNFGQTIDPFSNEFANTQVRSNQFALSASLNIFDGFKNLNTIKRNNANLEASKYELQKMKNDISLNVANQYLQILFNKELVRNAESQLKVTEIQEKRITKQVAVGALSEGSLRDIESQYATEELQKVKAQNQLELTRLNLAQLLNFENANNFSISEPTLNDPEDIAALATPNALYQIAIDILPEIKSAEYHLYSSEKSASLAKGNYYPSLSLAGSIGTGYSGNSRKFVDAIILPPSPNGNFTASGELILSPNIVPIYEVSPFSDQLNDNFNKSIGFRLNIPIFNGLSARTNVQKAKLNVEKAQLNLENTKLQLRQNIEAAHNDAVSALKRFKAAEKSVTSLKLSFQYTQERFNVGMLNSFDYNNEKNRLNNAQSELLQAKYEYLFKLKVLDFYQGKTIAFN